MEAVRKSSISSQSVLASHAIVSIRRNRGFSREQSATRAGISREHLWAVETNQYAPSLCTVQKLARAFDISLARFVSTGAVLLEDPLIRSIQPLVRRLNERQKNQILRTLRAIGGPPWRRI